jgi:DNA invertase Pin-like site-specific DNA recombinase
MEGRFVSYYRVSTDKQGRSGLGLEAQRKAVADYLNGGGWRLVGEFKEVESGRRNDRPQLAAAIAAARKHKATLLVAKMDRLGRRRARLLTLLDERRVKVRFVEMPDASDLELGIRAVIAQEEARLISTRTKDALAAAKARGTKLGTTGKQRAVENRAAAKAFARSLRPILRELRGQGVTSVRGIAAALTARGISTATGGKTWHPTQVARALARL